MHAEVGESRLSQTVDTEDPDLSGYHSQSQSYSQSQSHAESQSDSRHSSPPRNLLRTTSTAAARDETPSPSRLSDSTRSDGSDGSDSPGENNASYSRIGYGIEGEEDDVESEHDDEDEVGASHSSKPKVFSFAGRNSYCVLFIVFPRIIDDVERQISCYALKCP